ncbi:MAG: hypothetical protein ACJAS4_002664 [Bacteriovoracaceae bacterium]|jgi:hypothetical protein
MRYILFVLIFQATFFSGYFGINFYESGSSQVEAKSFVLSQQAYSRKAFSDQDPPFEVPQDNISSPSNLVQCSKKFINFILLEACKKTRDYLSSIHPRSPPVSS